MPVSFRIIPERNLALVTYSGHAGADETVSAAAQFATHPDFRHGLHHLFDVRNVTSHEKDFTKFFRMQGKLIEIYGQNTGHNTLAAFLVSDPGGRAMAETTIKSWSDVSHMVVVLFDDEAEALAFLGLPEKRINDLPPAQMAADR